MDRMMENGPLVFIHLSDIHFNKKWCDRYDLDRDLRDQLENDVAVMRERVPRVNGILITGDVAFGGKKEDYAEALSWLKRLCEIAGCEQKNVWVVPGNHDVDRTVFDNSLMIRQMHDGLRKGSPDQIDQRLTECLRDTAAVVEMFRPIEKYNSDLHRYSAVAVTPTSTGSKSLA